MVSRREGGQSVRGPLPRGSEVAQNLMTKVAHVGAALPHKFLFRPLEPHLHLSDLCQHGMFDPDQILSHAPFAFLGKEGIFEHGQTHLNQSDLLVRLLGLKLLPDDYPILGLTPPRRGPTGLSPIPRLPERCLARRVRIHAPADRPRPPRPLIQGKPLCLAVSCPTNRVKARRCCISSSFVVRSFFI